jgi:hypothetical protein
MAAPVLAQALNGAEPFERGQLEQLAFESMPVVHGLGVDQIRHFFRDTGLAKASIACSCDPYGKKAGRSSDYYVNS